MKVLFLNPAGVMGGAERALVDLIASLREANPEWELELIAAAEGELLEQTRDIGVAGLLLPFPGLLAASGDAGAGGPAGGQTAVLNVLARMGAASPGVALYVRRLSRVIAVSAPDLIHTNGFKMHVLGAWAAPRRVPLVWHIHDFVGARPLMSRLLRIHSRRCSSVIANSFSVADDVRASLGKRVPIHTVYNSVDLQRFAPVGSTLDLDALAGMSKAEDPIVRVGLVATMARWKGHEIFLRAISMLPREIPLRGYVIGGPIYQTIGSQYTVEELRELAVTLNIADRVGFTGFIRDSAAAMRALDVVVHASVAPEPFGLVIAEALACGRPVIASAGGGAAELITPGKTALTHQPGDTVELARLIAQLAGDPVLRTELGMAGRRSAQFLFTRARMATEMTRIYYQAAPKGVAMTGATPFR